MRASHIERSVSLNSYATVLLPPRYFMQDDHQMDIPDALNPTRPFAICVLIATNVYSLTKDRV